jgi:hypothetical protein
MESAQNIRIVHKGAKINWSTTGFLLSLKGISQKTSTHYSINLLNRLSRSALSAIISVPNASIFYLRIKIHLILIA